jgi:hypothetical protein
MEVHYQCGRSGHPGDRADAPALINVDSNIHGAISINMNVAG